MSKMRPPSPPPSRPDASKHRHGLTPASTVTA
jgi:hypothetical protein